MASDGPPSTLLAQVTWADAGNAIYGIAYSGQIFEAVDPNGTQPAVGDMVLADYLPSSGQWVIIATGVGPGSGASACPTCVMSLSPTLVSVGGVSPTLETDLSPGLVSVAGVSPTLETDLSFTLTV